mgnify:CR=1 FL=1
MQAAAQKTAADNNRKYLAAAELPLCTVFVTGGVLFSCLSLCCQNQIGFVQNTQLCKIAIF